MHETITLVKANEIVTQVKAKCWKSYVWIKKILKVNVSLNFFHLAIHDLIVGHEK